MKIAVITDDMVTVSQHFGMARYYVVAHVEDGKVVKKETRDKAGHHTFAGTNEAAHEAEHVDAQGRRGYGQVAQDKHATMAEAIKDCKALICGGMGWGAYESMRNYNIEAIVSDVELIDEAIDLYIKGQLTNLMQRLH